MGRKGKIVQLFQVEHYLVLFSVDWVSINDSCSHSIVHFAHGSRQLFKTSKLCQPLWSSVIRLPSYGTLQMQIRINFPESCCFICGHFICSCEYVAFPWGPENHVHLLHPQAEGCACTILRPLFQEELVYPSWLADWFP